MMPRLILLALLSLLQASQATVLIFWTDSDGVTNCEVRHDLDDCGFANVNPAVDCFPWFSMTGTGNTGPVIINNHSVLPADRDEGYLYNDIGLPSPTPEYLEYDNYLVRESCMLRGGSKVVIAIIAKDSDGPTVTRLASAGCDSMYRMISVPKTKKTGTIKVDGVDVGTVEVGTTSIQQQYGEILIDGVVFEIE